MKNLLIVFAFLLSLTGYGQEIISDSTFRPTKAGRRVLSNVGDGVMNSKAITGDADIYGVQSFRTIGELKRKLGEPRAGVQYRVFEKGKMGFFEYDAADNSSADDGKYILNINGKRIKRVIDPLLAIEVKDTLELKAICAIGATKAHFDGCDWEYKTGYKKSDGGVTYNIDATHYVERKFSGPVLSDWFGVNELLSDNTANLQRLFDYCMANVKSPLIRLGTYKVKGELYITYTKVIAQNGISIFGEFDSYRTVKFLYSGNAWCLNILGIGDEGTNPITRFTIRNITIDGQNNTTSLGGYNLKRCYFLTLERCSSVNWSHPNAHAGSIRNSFNCHILKGNFQGGFPVATGNSGWIVGSELPDAWNTSNIRFEDCAIQRFGKFGVEVVHEANILDNISFRDVTFGGNRQGSFYSNNPHVNNIGFDHVHFEGAGLNGTNTPDSAIHVDIRQASAVKVGTCEFKDARVHINFHAVKGFSIDPCKIYETNYTIPNSVGIQITGTPEAYCRGSIEPQEIWSHQIDKPYVRNDYTRINWPLDQVNEAQWAATYANNAYLYRGAIICRYELRSEQAEGVFYRFWTSDGNQWVRLAVTSRLLGFAAAMPTTGTFTKGDVLMNIEPSFQGVAPKQYTVFAWVRLTSGTTHVLGQDWLEVKNFLTSETYINGTTVFVDPLTSSVAAGAEVVQQYTVSGVALNNLLTARFTADVSDVMITGVKITAANTVKVIVKNTGSTAVTMTGKIAFTFK